MKHRPAIELPAPCAGNMLPGVDLCARDAEVVTFGPVAQDDGSPAMAWVFVCRKHVRQALRMLRESTPFPEDIEALSIDQFVHVQGLGIFARNGIEAPQLRRSA